ncbi:MFS transporter [Sulfuriflexus sp.]|uniref:MFS transporter n=1 Tax=Sulfuriflexus sp. TaxID=2015443 RepID=UPI0028CFAB3F|nr:MFS transporter [Sulfuriflexus sp.]MDT8405268.1 MFS transporter [Sulfuriflexus sp.]
MHIDEQRRFRWVRTSIYLILIVSYMSVYFHRMAPAVVSAELMATFHTSAAALGSLAAMYYYIYTLMQIPAGVLADTLGNRASVTAGNLIAGLGSILFAMAETFELASLGRFMVGLGVSVIFVGLMKNNTVWYRDRIYGLVSGVTLLMGNLGSVLAARPLSALLNIWTWREIFLAMGFVSLALAVLSLLYVRNRPEDAGFPSVREMDGLASHAERHQHWFRDLLAVLRNLAVWPGFWINFGMAGGLFAFAGLWGIPLLRDSFDLGRDEASLYTTITLLSLAVGTLLAGWLSDRIGLRKPVILTSAAIYMLAWLALIYVPWQPGMLAMLLFMLIGLTGGGFVLTYPCAKEVTQPALSGMAISLVNTGLFLGAAIMQPLFGWVLDQGWDGATAAGINVYSWQNYQDAMSLMLGFATLAFIGALRIKETRCHNLTLQRE